MYNANHPMLILRPCGPYILSYQTKIHQLKGLTGLRINKKLESKRHFRNSNPFFRIRNLHVSCDLLLPTANLTTQNFYLYINSEGASWQKSAAHSKLERNFRTSPYVPMKLSSSDVPNEATNDCDQQLKIIGMTWSIAVFLKREIWLARAPATLEWWQLVHGHLTLKQVGSGEGIVTIYLLSDTRPYFFLSIRDKVGINWSCWVNHALPVSLHSIARG
jgi:hypothetical protein